MACELVKGLTNKFKETVTAAISGYVTTLLAEYATDPVRKWRQKDCAVRAPRPPKPRLRLQYGRSLANTSSIIRTSSKFSDPAKLTPDIY